MMLDSIDWARRVLKVINVTISKVGTSFLWSFTQYIIGFYSLFNLILVLVLSQITIWVYEVPDYFPSCITEDSDE